MGFTYLDGKSWSEVSRDERFFCMQLYSKIVEHGTADFIDFINRQCGTALNLDAEWEVGYEVCFYRDFYHFKERKVKLLSPKRTFDLCLFSEQTIVIIEAKCHEEFEAEQLRDFDRDRERMASLPGLEQVQVVLLALASKRYQPQEHIAECFDSGARFLTWEDLAAHYGDDPLLNRAGDIYSSEARRFNSARNTGGSLTGKELLECYRRGEDFWVGRYKELLGIKEDMIAGKWPTKRYQTNRSADPLPPASRNWFRLSQLGELLHRAVPSDPPCQTQANKCLHQSGGSLPGA